jgi:hypothetical protein
MDLMVFIIFTTWGPQNLLKKYEQIICHHSKPMSLMITDQVF